MLILSALASFAWLQPHETSVAAEAAAIPTKNYVLILMLYDPDKTYHVVRAAVYTSPDSCNEGGKHVLKAVNIGPVKNQSYFCLETDLPN